MPLTLASGKPLERSKGAFSMMARHSQPRPELVDRAVEAIDSAIGANDDGDAPAAPVPKSPARKRARKTPVERTAPEPYYADDALPMRCVFVNGKQLLTLLRSLGTFGENIMLDFHPSDGLTVHQMHEGRTCFVDVRVPASSFLVYACERARSFLLFYEQVKQLNAIANQQHTLTFFEEPRRHKARLCARLHSAASDRLMLLSTQSAENADAPVELPYREWAYPMRVHMDATAFADSARSCVQTSSSAVEWAVDARNRFLWRSFSDSIGNNSEVAILSLRPELVERTPGGAPVTQQFSARYLAALAAVGTAASGAELRFGLAGHPVHVRFVVADGERTLFTIDGVLMPREGDEVPMEAAVE